MNCNGGIIDNATTGTVNASETSSRVRSCEASSWIRASTPSVVPTSPDEPLGAGKVAVYPVASTVEIKSSGATAPVKSTFAFSVA